WYDEFFKEDYLQIYLPFLTEERTKQEIDFIIEILNLPPGSKILDLACGFGRHTIPLAKKGYDMTGLDYTEKFIRMAEEKAQKENLQIEFLVGDMRKIPFENHFAGVISYFTSFGFFSDEENFEVLKGVSKALKREGKFLLEIMNRDFLVKNFRPKNWQRLEDGTLVLEENSLDLMTNRLKNYKIIIDKKGERTKWFELRLYTLQELVYLLEKVGLKVIQTYGKKDKSPYSVDSPRMIVLSQKI
ncbi:MAG: class I SAM-dependent methyltransferase, partial [candidate division Zixibacteria bacterium]|nr:class I SAM-dependent methyltransferase [candidate division Zixibacteria bacterium]